MFIEIPGANYMFWGETKKAPTLEIPQYSYSFHIRLLKECQFAKRAQPIRKDHLKRKETSEELRGCRRSATMGHL